MTTKRIDELTAATALTADDLLVTMDGATTTKKITAANARTYMLPTAAETLALLVTVDGAGSGLDADTLDGSSSAAFATSAQGALADTAVQPARSISTTAPLTGGGDLSANRTLAVSAASDTASGVVELATSAETQTGTDTARAVTPAGAAATFAPLAHNQAASTITSGTIDTARLGSGSASASTYLRGDQTWAAVSAGAVDLGRPAKSGTIYPTIPGWWINGTANFAFSAGTVYYFPVVIEAAKTVTDVGIEVQTGGAAATTARLGIHTADTSWQPVAVALDAGTVATDSTGVKTVTGLSTALAAGRYLFTVWFSGGPTLRCLQGGPIGGALDSAGGTNPQIMLWRGASAYGGTYPATPVAWASVTGNTTAYAPMWAKFA